MVLRKWIVKLVLRTSVTVTFDTVKNHGAPKPVPTHSRREECDRDLRPRLDDGEVYERVPLPRRREVQGSQTYTGVRKRSEVTHLPKATEGALAT